MNKFDVIVNNDCSEIEEELKYIRVICPNAKTCTITKGHCIHDRYHQLITSCSSDREINCPNCVTELSARDPNIKKNAIRIHATQDITY